MFACPRVAPDWELAALRALMKPQLRGAIENRPAGQVWSVTAEKVLRSVCCDVRGRLRYEPPLHFPKSGDYFFVTDVENASVEEAKGFARVVSKRLPGLWFVFGRLFIKAGVFYRRERGIKLNLVVATNVHLTRPMRAALRDLL